MPPILHRLLGSGGTAAFESAGVIRAEILSAERLDTSSRRRSGRSVTTCLPATTDRCPGWPRGRWPGFRVALRYRGTHYEIAVENPRGANRRLGGLWLDDKALPAEHRVVQP